MKKTLFYAAFAAVIALASCQKEEIPGPESGEKLVFHATIAQPAKTTVVIDGAKGKVSFEVGDTVIIKDAGMKTAKYVASTVSAGVATLEFESGETLMTAPYTATHGSEILSSQTWPAEKNNLYMTASSSTTSLTFDVACGLIKLNLQAAGENIKSVVVSDGSKNYTLGCEVAQSIESSKDFYIAVPAGSYSTFTFIDAAGKTCTSRAKKPISVATNEIQPITLTGLSFREYVVWFDSAELFGNQKYNGFKGSCPVFSPDSTTLYDITFNNGTVLYAFDLKTGAVKWSYKNETASGSYNMATVNPVNGDIYYGTTKSGQFFCVKDNGTLKWTYTGLGSLQSAAPAVSKDGSTVYAIDASGKVAAIKAVDGSEIWTYAAGAKGGSMLVNGNELVVAPTTTDLVFLNATTGAKIASIAATEFGANRTDIAGFAVAADKNTAYLPCNSGKLFSIDLKEHKILKSLTLTIGTETANNLYEPVVAPNGNVFVGSKNSFVYCVKGDLSEVLWGYSHLTAGTNNAYNYAHPCVDAAGNFYISSGQIINSNFIFSPTGTVIKQWTYGTSANQKQMGGNNYLDGILYSAFVGGGSENGLLVGKYVGGENAASWCRHGGDICGSCCVK